MAPPPQLRQIAKEALQGAPGWIDGLLGRLNGFLSQVGDALTSNLTVSENLAACWVEVPVTSGVYMGDVAVPGLRGRQPYGVIVARAEMLEGPDPATAGVTIQWEPSSFGIRIKGVYGLGTQKIRLYLLVLAR